MKKIVYFCIILLFSFSLTLGQTKGKAAVQKPSTVSLFAEAEKAWAPFWGSFRSAIVSRDTVRLRVLFARSYDRKSINQDVQYWLRKENRNAILSSKPHEIYEKDRPDVLERIVSWQISDPCCDISFQFRKTVGWKIFSFSCGCTA